MPSSQHLLHLFLVWSPLIPNPLIVPHSFPGCSSSSEVWPSADAVHCTHAHTTPTQPLYIIFISPISAYARLSVPGFFTTSISLRSLRSLHRSAYERLRIHGCRPMGVLSCSHSSVIRLCSVDKYSFHFFEIPCILGSPSRCLYIRSLRTASLNSVSFAVSAARPLCSISSSASSLSDSSSSCRRSDTPAVNLFVNNFNDETVKRCAGTSADLSAMLFEYTGTLHAHNDPRSEVWR